MTEDITPIQKQDLEGRFWDLCNGGKIQYVRYPIDYNKDAIRTLVRRAMDKAVCVGCGLKTLKADGKCSLTVGNRLLKQVKTGKEYYLCVGKHASIVRKTEEGKLQYLELQSAYNSGWTDFNGNPKSTLHDRFGCTSTSDYGTSSTYDFMIDIEESDFSTDDFKSLLGYINTSDSAQKKGKNGTIK